MTPGAAPVEILAAGGRHKLVQDFDGIVYFPRVSADELPANRPFIPEAMAVGRARSGLTRTDVVAFKEAPVRIELTNSRFAVCRLTTWPRRRYTPKVVDWL